MQRPSAETALLSTYTLERVVDAQLENSEPFTLIELFGTLNETIWSEVDAKSLHAQGAGGADAGPQNISSLRRGLQRLWLERLIDVSMNTKNGPMADARSVAPDDPHRSPEHDRYRPRRRGRA